MAVQLLLLGFVCSRFVVRNFEYAAAAESEEKGKLKLQIKKHFVSVFLSYHYPPNPSPPSQSRLY